MAETLNYSDWLVSSDAASTEKDCYRRSDEFDVVQNFGRAYQRSLTQGSPPRHYETAQRTSSGKESQLAIRVNIDEIHNYIATGGAKSLGNLWRSITRILPINAKAQMLKVVARQVRALRCCDEILNAHKLDASGNTDEALDSVYDEIDELLRSGEFETVDIALCYLRDMDLSLNIALGVLTSTLPAKSKLTFRSRLTRQVRNSLLSQGLDADSLLSGLE